VRRTSDADFLVRRISEAGLTGPSDSTGNHVESNICRGFELMGD
jgi:hypothetical protein